MRSGSFEIVITSPPDRDDVVAELSYNNAQILEVSWEHPPQFIVEIYPAPDGKPWHFDFDAFSIALQKTKERLIAMGTRQN